MDYNISTWLIKACKKPLPADSAHHGSAPPEGETRWLSLGLLDDLIYDTGATTHFTGHRNDYWTYKGISPRLVHGMNLQSYTPLEQAR